MQGFPPHRQLGLYALFVCLLFGAVLGKAQGGGAQTNKCPKWSPIPVGNLCLRDTSEEIAREVCSKDDPNDPRSLNDPNTKKTCAYNLIEQLGNMPESARCVGAQATDALLLRQEINDMVLTASLQVDGFTSEIDSETAQIRAVHDRLSDQRDASVARSTFWTAVGTGGGAVGSALALVGDTAATVGDYFGAVGGGVGAFFSFLGYFQQQRDPSGCFPDLRTSAQQEKEKKKEKKGHCGKLEDKPADQPEDMPAGKPEDKSENKEKDPSDCPEWDALKGGVQTSQNDTCRRGAENPPGCSPHMLYGLLCREQAEKAEAEEALEARNAAEAEKSATDEAKRAEIAKVAREKEKDWNAWWFHSAYEPGIQKYLQSTSPVGDKPRGVTLIDTWGGIQSVTKNISFYTGNTDPRKLTISILTDRANKLAELRTVVARMNRDLSRLTEDLAIGLRCPVDGPPEDRYWSSMDRTSGK